MEKYHNHPIAKTLLTLYLGLALLLAQIYSLHLHIQHDDHSSSASAHVVNVHAASILQDIDLANQHDDHHSTAVDIGSDNLIKKANLFNFLSLILLSTGLFLFKPRLAGTHRQKLFKILLPPCYYLLQPPLRAPPL